MFAFRAGPLARPLVKHPSPQSHGQDNSLKLGLELILTIPSPLISAAVPEVPGDFLMEGDILLL